MGKCFIKEKTKKVRPLPEPILPLQRYPCPSTLDLWVDQIISDKMGVPHMAVQEDSGKALSPLAMFGIIQAVFTRIVGLLFTLMLLFGEPVEQS